MTQIVRWFAAACVAAALAFTGAGAASASNAWAAPPVASNAWAAPVVDPDVLSWTAYQKCYFDAFHWENVRAHVDTIGTTKKNWQMQIGGTEKVDKVNIWERRGSTDIYTGGYAGAASANWLSPVTKLPYMASGAKRYAMIQIHRNSGPVALQYCGLAIDIG